MNPVYVVFADAFAKRLRQADWVFPSMGEAKRHAKELKQMGNEPVIAVARDEESFDKWINHELNAFPKA